MIAREQAATGLVHTKRTATPKMLPLVEGLGRLLLAGTFAGAELLEGAAPFALAFVAATGAGVLGFFALIGALGGYFLFHGTAGGLHYMAGSILVYAASFALYDCKWREVKALIPSAALVLGGLCRFLSIDGQGWNPGRLIGFGLELLLFFLGTWLFRAGLQAVGRTGYYIAAQSDMERAGLLFAGVVALIALGSVQFYGEFSLGRVLALLMVLLIAKSGAKDGLFAGCLVGLAMDMAAGRGPYYCMSYAVSGFAAGLARERGHMVTLLVYVAAQTATLLWTWETGMRIGMLYELLAAVILYLLLPRRLKEKGVQCLTVPVRDAGIWEGGRSRAVRHVQETAKAFRALYESLQMPETRSSNVEDVAEVFHRAAERECRKCASRDECWGQDYQSTQQTLGAVVSPMLARGRVEAEDFAPHFRSRCRRFNGFLATVNEELKAFLYHKQYQHRVEEGQALLRRQYRDLGGILEQTAREMAGEFTPDLPRERKLRRYLQEHGLDASGRVYYNVQKQLVVELPYSERLAGERGRDELSTLLGIKLRGGEDEEMLQFYQVEKLVAAAAVAACPKAGESVNGDSGTWFRREDGLLCILLCDGMGSGEIARQESSLTVELLRHFLKAGVAPEAALSTVNGAMALRGEYGGGCSSVDLLTVELHSGLCAVYKLGAAPSYLCRGGEVRKVQGAALPMGIHAEATAEVTRFRAQAGDFVVLGSDGLTLEDEEETLRPIIQEYEGKSPGELAGRILETGSEPTHADDDSTVIVLRIDARVAT